MDGIEQISRWVTEHEALLSGLAALLAIGAIIPALIRLVWRRRNPVVGERPSGVGSGKLAASDLPRIAVLPFDAPGGKAELVTEAELLQDEVTTLLARSSGCEVISRSSATTFALGGGRTADAGRELGVRYVVEGQARPTESGLRVTASLVDTKEDRVVWSDSFEEETGARSSVSQQLSQRIASHLGVEVARAEVSLGGQRRHGRAARDLVLAAQGILFAEGHHRHTYERAITLLEQAIKKDPNAPEAHGLLALLLALGDAFAFFDQNDAFREKVVVACRRALEIDDRSSEVLGFVGCAYCDIGQNEQGIPLLERAVAANPSNAQAKAALGAGYEGVKRREDAIRMIEDALRISPAHKGVAPWATVLARCYLAEGRFGEATDAIKRALHFDPTFFPAHLTAALVSSQRGDGDAARRHIREAYRIRPDLDEATLNKLVGRVGEGVIQQIRSEGP